MKIIVPAIGSRGDVQPYIALCQGLKRAGHRAILATNPTLLSLAKSYNVDSVPVGPPVDMGAEGARIWEKAGRFWMLGFMGIMRLGMRLVEQAFPDIYELSKHADLIIATDILAGAAEADKLGLPWISVTLQPARIPVPPGQAPPLPARVMWGVVGSLVTAPLNRFRRRVGAPPVKGDISGMMSKRMILLPVSPHVAPPNPRWPAYTHVTGYWFSRSPEAWNPPEDLLHFLECGEKPVVVSLGAMSLSGKSAREAALITLKAIRLAGVRAVVQGWHEALAGESLPPQVYHAGSMPHTWLFAQAAAVVHHGGFGTAASGLASGAPSLVIPHIIDQAYWGQRVHELGVGPQPIHRARLNPGRLAEALRQAVSDEVMRSKAAGLGEKIRAEPDGVEAAVRLIEGIG